MVVAAPRLDGFENFGWCFCSKSSVERLEMSMGGRKSVHPLDQLVFMCNDAPSSLDGILGLVQDAVGSIVWISDDDSLLWHL